MTVAKKHDMGSFFKTFEELFTAFRIQFGKQRAVGPFLKFFLRDWQLMLHMDLKIVKTLVD